MHSCWEPCKLDTSAVSYNSVLSSDGFTEQWNLDCGFFFQVYTIRTKYFCCFMLKVFIYLPSEWKCVYLWENMNNELVKSFQHGYLKKINSCSLCLLKKKKNKFMFPLPPKILGKPSYIFSQIKEKKYLRVCRLRQHFYPYLLVSLTITSFFTTLPFLKIKFEVRMQRWLNGNNAILFNWLLQTYLI